MSFLINQCIFRNMKRSVHEISRLRCILTEIKTGFVENKKFLPSLQQSCRFTSDSNAFDNKQISETEKIYQGSMTKQVRTIKVFTLITSITGIISQPMLYAKFEEIGLSPAMVGFGAFYGFFTLISPLLIHLVTKRYVTQIEYNSKEDYYTAYTYTFFVQRKKIQFTPDDVQVPDIPRMLTTFVVKNNSLFVDPKMFEDIGHYKRIMGYDKPLDFSLDSDSKDDKK
ncbi:transmembrane protein 70 homolog, mitochondrial isoform X1 [Diprion similis]|uniref:transmembrane protein 70 homolog, mitochondrial isoform X1 n=1 Tax=Diprion similis TaxID=362088 RepID=UPI001EF94751|nr:transmembrane protein 70 homolog, mitochondrial isoform X1 [Diprion similis]